MSVPALLRRTTPLLLAAPLALGCENPQVDGSNAPTPTGIMEGAILYSGPRPQCHFDAGVPYEVPGHVVLLLFAYDNPPPPSGTATSAANLLVLPGSELFSLDDCMPESPSESDLEPIARTVAFTWPSLTLGETYQVRGFYDGDGDFNPFFSVRNLATAGDVGGGAFVDPSASPLVYAPVAFPSASDAPAGSIVAGVSVTLGAVIQTERPLFEVEASSQALASSATIPTDSDTFARENALVALTNMRVSLVAGPDSTDGRGNTYGDALTAAGLGYDFRAMRHGMPIATVDADGDGVGDLHPVLGSAGVPWYSPMLFFRRARNPIEQRAGVPDVLFVGSIRPTVPLGATQGFVPRSTITSADVIVPPVALVTLDASNAACRIPYLAPGNIGELYESQATDCQELPTGNYDINVLAGAAGGTVVDVFAECVARCVAGGSTESDCTPGCTTEASLRSDTGYVYEGASYSSQSWSIPNELGCPDSSYRSTAVNQLDAPRADGSLPSCSESELLLETQGRAGGFAIVDDDGGDAPAGDDTTDGHGIASCQSAFHAATGMVSPVTYVAPDEACCAAVASLCGLPLCPLRDASTTGYPEGVRASAGGSRQTREMRVEGEDYRLRSDGSVEALCVPFLMPAGCCR